MGVYFNHMGVYLMGRPPTIGFLVCFPSSSGLWEVSLF